jgi:ABC-type multidrug transport system fused ATPase/permease subunit
VKALLLAGYDMWALLLARPAPLSAPSRLPPNLTPPPLDPQFTKDQDVIDEALPDALYYTGIYGLILCATTITVSVTIPLFSAMAGGLYLVSLLMLFLYLPAATHLKKLRLNTAGDVVTLVAEALDGLPVIQAYGKQPYFVRITSQHVNDAHRALFGAESLNLWLAFFCDLYGAIMVLAVASFGISQWRSLGSSAVGLAFSQSIQMLVFYTGSIRLLADCIGLFGSVEKLNSLANHTPQEGGRLAPPSLTGGVNRKAGVSSVGKSLPPPKSSMESEIAAINKATKVPLGWPRTGDIVFEGEWGGEWGGRAGLQRRIRARSCLRALLERRLTCDSPNPSKTPRRCVHEVRSPPAPGSARRELPHQER